MPVRTNVDPYAWDSVHVDAAIMEIFVMSIPPSLAPAEAWPIVAGAALIQINDCRRCLAATQGRARLAFTKCGPGRSA